MAENDFDCTNHKPSMPVYIDNVLTSRVIATYNLNPSNRLGGFNKVGPVPVLREGECYETDLDGNTHIFMIGE